MRRLITTMDDTSACQPQYAARGGCGTVVEYYDGRDSTDRVNHGAAVHTVIGGLLRESIFYSNSRGKAMMVQEFYMKMNRCGAGDTTQCNRLDNFVDPSKYLAVFSPVPAAVGGRVKNTDAPGQTLTLDELKQWLQERPPVCESDTDCLPNDSRKLDQQGNSVIETYTAQAWTEDQGCAAPPCTQEVTGLTVNRFINDQDAGTQSGDVILETYFYTQHADEVCSNAARGRVARRFVGLIDELSLMQPGSASNTRGDRIDEFQDLYWCAHIPTGAWRGVNQASSRVEGKAPRQV